MSLLHLMSVDIYRLERLLLTCELHGYQSSLSPPVWLNTNGSETNDSTKYTVFVCEGLNTIILQNGTVFSSIILSITIHNLSSADGGTYTCRGVRGESVTQLTILEGTSPPSTSTLLSQTCIPIHLVLRK